MLSTTAHASSTSRPWDEERFDAAYSTCIVGGRFQEVPEYYERYRNRYRDVLKLYAQHVPAEPQNVLDVGGGQLSVLCQDLWGDDAEVADIGGPHLAHLRERGIRVHTWNLAVEPNPVEDRFDVVLFSEVIEHIPMPGHVVLEKLRRTLKPGGLLICTTPNLYRARNIVYLATGRQIFDYFRVPVDGGLGHVIEYSSDHLAWQFAEAGFTEVEVEFRQVGHVPHGATFRVLYRIGSPLFRVPRLRDNLFAVGRRPRNAGQ